PDPNFPPHVLLYATSEPAPGSGITRPVSKATEAALVPGTDWQYLIVGFDGVNLLGWDPTHISGFGVKIYSGIDPMEADGGVPTAQPTSAVLRIDNIIVD